MFYHFLNIDFITISEEYENQLEDPSNQQPDKQFKNSSINSSINSSNNNNSNHNNHKSQIKNLKNQLSGRIKNKKERMLESQTISSPM